MAALVELEMHRLSKQRGAHGHECQRKAATFNISTFKQKHQAVSEPIVESLLPVLAIIL